MTTNTNSTVRANSMMLVDKLHEDILLCIFSMNTYSPESESGHVPIQPSALTTTRYTSQVCRSWRNILLCSPSIWGNLIDLDELIKASNNWVEEVLLRTGSALLSIYGEVSQWSNTLFSSLLDKQWYRVRRLDICLFRFGFSTVPDEAIWNIFWARPAPNLEKFLLRGAFLDTQMHNPSLLFSGSAPSLHRMHSHIFQCYHPWVSQLSSLTISPSFTVLDALTTLLHCSEQLQSLVIQGSQARVPLEWSRPIHLPNLLRMRIAGSPSAVIVYLASITPNPNCALVLDVQAHATANVTEYHHIASLVAPYATKYFELHHPKVLSIDTTAGYVKIEHPTTFLSSDCGYFGHPDFCALVGITFGNPIIAPSILGILSSANLESVVDLNLRFGTIVRFQNLTSTELAHFKVFFSFASVKRLTMPPEGLAFFNFLHQIREALITTGHGCERLFPNLTDLILLSAAVVSQKADRDFERRLTEFLSILMDGGNLVRLDITKYFLQHGKDQWGFLSAIDGLRVVYEGSEYVCGQGEEGIEMWFETLPLNGLSNFSKFSDALLESNYVN